MKLPQSNTLGLHMLVNKHSVDLPLIGQQPTKLKLKARFKRNHKRVGLQCGVCPERLTPQTGPISHQSTIIAMALMVVTHATSYLPQLKNKPMQSTT
jgi:hypothetical protein